MTMDKSSPMDRIVAGLVTSRATPLGRSVGILSVFAAMGLVIGVVVGGLTVLGFEILGRGLGDSAKSLIVIAWIIGAVGMSAARGWPLAASAYGKRRSETQ